MKSSTSFILVLFAAKILSVSAQFYEACDIKDIVCIRKSAVMFFEQTAPGVPELGIAKSDPLVVPPFNVLFEEPGLKFKLKNTNVSGLKNTYLEKWIYKKHVVLRSVHIIFRNIFKIASDIIIENTRNSKSYEGSFTATANVSGGLTYTLDRKLSELGNHHFKLGKHVLTCELDNSPQLKFNSELAQKLDNDDYWKSLYEDELKVIREVTFCKIAREAYDAVMHNLQAIFEFIPLNKLLKNVD